MPDSISPPAGSRRDPRDVPDPQFWGPEREPRVRLRRTPGAAGGLLDRLRDLRADPRSGVIALVVVAAVAGFAWYRMGLGDTGETGAAAPPARTPAAAPVSPTTTATSTTGASTTTGPGGDVTVHVAGAVLRPGVIELPAGSRVIDAVEAAGGGVPEADLDRMNLAAQLVDGQRILVQKVGEPVAPADPADPASTDGAPTNQPINLNTATQEQLETLPGIGPTLAEAIIVERDRRGGFRSINELRDVRGIGDQRFADVEALVTV
ncbi:MAG: helix-hairpin-helix domain-containing protein [Acidimicrobiia bacterium]